MRIKNCPFCGSHVITFNGNEAATCNGCGVTFTASAGKSILEAFIESTPSQTSLTTNAQPYYSETAQESVPAPDEGLEEYDFGDVDSEEQFTTPQAQPQFGSTAVNFGGV